MGEWEWVRDREDDEVRRGCRTQEANKRRRLLEWCWRGRGRKLVGGRVG